MERSSEIIVVGTLSSLGNFQLDDHNFGCSNTNCSHLCVASHNRLSSKKYECLCPLGYSRSIEEYVFKVIPYLLVFSEIRCQPTIQCKDWQFACHNGFECIHSALKCDKFPDCFDSSDESPLRCNLINKEKHPIQPGPNQWVCDDRRMSIKRHLVSSTSFII